MHRTPTFPLAALLLVAPLALAACGDKDGDDSGATSDGGASDGGTSDGGTEPLTDAEIAAALWTAIDGYTGWGQKDGWTTSPVLSGSHMDAYVVAYYDDALMAWDMSGAAPDGAISVKEQYMAATDADPASLTVMQKRAGYDPDNGDWFWAMYAPDGTVMEAGKVEMCSGCHASASTDSVFGAPPAAE
ncbi:cytochrome P460 family protein [Myxococcota bacterium]|nr:cytochrome P460 family protein [Myxococcota bacterium]